MINPPSIVAASPDYVLGLEKNQWVLVPIGADTTGGRTVSETARILVGSQTSPTGSITTPFNLTVGGSGSLTVNMSGSIVTLAPTGTGTVTVGSAGTGNTTLGASGTGITTLNRVNWFNVVSTDTSGTPGNATNNNSSGRAAFAAAGSTVVITSAVVTAASKIFVQLLTADATLKNVTVTPAAGSFTVTGNAAATGTTIFDYLIVN